MAQGPTELKTTSLMEPQRSIVALNVLFILLSQFVIGCAHTPGDAAFRAGHPKHAATLYAQGAKQGDSIAALKLGLLLEEGDVKTDDFGTPTFWYERACNLGSLPGCHNLGVSYEYGKNGVQADMMKAREFYLKAAERGYMQSQYNLASLYSNHYIEPADDAEGYKWMLLAQQSAKKCEEVSICRWILEDPPGHKARLEGRLNKNQIKEAEALADSWNPQR